VAPGLGGFAGVPFVIVMASSPVPILSNKKPPPPGEGPFGLRWWRRLALVPPRSSVLPPGAGNEPKKAIQPKKERAKKPEERNVGETGVVHGHLDAAAIARHDDGDSSAVPAIEQTQYGLQYLAPHDRPDAAMCRGV
jgi:hypothetical protein